MSTVSGLVAAGADTSMLHHPHQVSDLASPGDRFVQIVNFDSPAYDNPNRVDIPILDMVVDDLWVEFQVTALSGTNASFVPTQSWISSNGVQLLYKNQQVYTMSEAEAIVYDRMTVSTMPVFQKWLDASGDMPVANRRTTASAAAVYYMHLGPLVRKILSHAGPLTSYPSKAWSIIVSLLPANRIIQSTSGTPTGGALSKMRLIASGHRESADNAQRVADALAGEGVRISFNQSNWQQTSYSASAVSHTVNLTSLEGEATDVVIMQRVTAGLASTTATTVDRWATETGGGTAAINYKLAGDTIEMGTQANPTRVFGLALPIRTIKMIEQGKAYTGSSAFCDATGTYRNEPVMYISLSEGGTLGQEFGTFSGALRLKNNFQYTLRWASTVSANTVDTIVYVMRDMLLKHSGMVMINREA